MVALRFNGEWWRCGARGGVGFEIWRGPSQRRSRTIVMPIIGLKATGDIAFSLDITYRPQSGIHCLTNLCS